MITLDTTRIDAETNKLIEEAKAAERFRLMAIAAAHRYIEKIEPILKKRKIEIASSQMFFNPVRDKHDHALVILEFSTIYGTYDGVKVKNLQKELVEAGIPMLVGAPSRNITITLYEETIHNYKP